MRASLAGLAGASFFAVLLSSGAAAQATTLTYSATSATYVPTPNAGVNTRPLQLNQGGNALTAFSRNFIYTGLNSTALGGNWVPLGQSTTTSGEQRFDYKFGAATGAIAGPPAQQLWNNNFTLDFGSFYLDGSCDFCGAANAVTLTSVSGTGMGQYIGQDPNGNPGNQNNLTSDIYNITFGSSGYTGTLQFTAATDVTFGSPDVQLSRGTITLNIFAPAPAPLPLFGAGAAFGMSRQLRRRIQRQSKGVVAQG
jgi:hypothetical protein